MIFKVGFILFIGNSRKSAIDACSAKLFQCLKDHKCDKALFLTRSSSKSSLVKAAERRGFSIDNANVQLTEGDNYSIKPAQLTITQYLDGTTRQDIHNALDHLKFTDLDLKLIDYNSSGKRMFSTIVFCVFFLVTISSLDF